ncbi:hypothetical protein EVAR_83876_1 [Eumeta japonica]|uniref:Uncharacterized protein n=1 Tax=Eumeta variegata TaxID=151549 RepID=A0A4C1USL2_EUMVA|nr:hypothetical protein EVAR_83876_1 [Eumeta japonica]
MQLEASDLDKEVPWSFLTKSRFAECSPLTKHRDIAHTPRGLASGGARASSAADTSIKYVTTERTAAAAPARAPPHPKHRHTLFLNRMTQHKDTSDNTSQSSRSQTWCDIFGMPPQGAEQNDGPGLTFHQLQFPVQSPYKGLCLTAPAASRFEGDWNKETDILHDAVLKIFSVWRKIGSGTEEVLHLTCQN